MAGRVVCGRTQAGRQAGRNLENGGIPETCTQVRTQQNRDLQADPHPPPDPGRQAGSASRQAAGSIEIPENGIRQQCSAMQVAAESRRTEVP